jgi:hypothetical protein
LFGVIARKRELKFFLLSIVFSIIQYHLRAEAAAAFDLPWSRDFLEYCTPDAPVILNPADTLATFSGAGTIRTIVACHDSLLAGQHFRLSERGLAIRADEGEKEVTGRE